MKTKRMLATAVVGWVCAAAASASDYDFYAGLRYPGAERRPDVDIYKVKQAGKGDPKAYERRDVAHRLAVYFLTFFLAFFLAFLVAFFLAFLAFFLTTFFLAFFFAAFLAFFAIRYHLLPWS